MLFGLNIATGPEFKPQHRPFWTLRRWTHAAQILYQADASDCCFIKRSRRIEKPCATRAISHGLKSMCAEQEEREKEEEEEYINIMMMIKDESVIDGRLMSERVNGRSERVIQSAKKKSFKPVRIGVDSQVCLWRR